MVVETILKALAAPHRREILALVRARELPAGSIAERFEITRPAVSQHLAVLKDAGLLAERRDGTRRLYRAKAGSLMGLGMYLDDLVVPRLSDASDPDDLGNARGARGVTRERVSVEREVLVVSPPEVVWDLLADPGQTTRWMGRRARFDLRVGGRYQVEVLPGLVASGEFLQIDRPHRLVHSWGWELEWGPVPPGSTVVVFDVLERGDGTLVRISHRGLPSLDTAGSHSRGWAHYLARLAALALGEAPGPDPWANDPERMRRELRPASGGSPTDPHAKGDRG
jgi:uncharacterized protein YndB with AHSA1/START domain